MERKTVPIVPGWIGMNLHLLGMHLILIYFLFSQAFLQVHPTSLDIRSGTTNLVHVGLLGYVGLREVQARVPCNVSLEPRANVLANLHL